MALDFIMLRLDLADDPRILRLAGIIDREVATVVGAFTLHLMWFDKHTEDGVARHATRELHDRVTGIEGFAAALEAVGWLEVHEDGLTMPHFDTWNGKSSKKRGKAARRQRDHRARKADEEVAVRPELGVEEVLKRIGISNPTRQRLVDAEIKADYCVELWAEVCRSPKVRNRQAVFVRQAMTDHGLDAVGAAGKLSGADLDAMKRIDRARRNRMGAA